MTFKKGILHPDNNSFGVNINQIYNILARKFKGKPHKFLPDKTVWDKTRPTHNIDLHLHWDFSKMEDMFLSFDVEFLLHFWLP